MSKRLEFAMLPFFISVEELNCHVEARAVVRIQISHRSFVTRAFSGEQTLVAFVFCLVQCFLSHCKLMLMYIRLDSAIVCLPG